MKTVISFILIIFMSIATFLGGFSGSSADLSVNENFSKEIVLSDDEKALLSEIFETETAWLASLQLDNGAIPMTANKNGVVSVNPYFADFAALALLDNSEKYADNVKNYIEWHFAHLNTAKTDYNGVDGTIYDYSVTVENGIVKKEEITVKDGKNSYDSTDSYAATFLMVLEKYYEKTDDSEYIISKSKDIERITDVIFATMNMGLTFAKPDYEVKYLMDNCEVYEGVLAAKALFDVISSNDDAYKMMQIKCEKAAIWMKQSIEKVLWNSENGHYESAVFKNGSTAFEFSWNEYYPSATAQLFTILHGVIDAETVRADSLYTAFCDNYKWEEFNIPSEFYWGSNVYVAALMNDSDRVITYMNHYRSLLEKHEYPLYNADSAKVSMAAFEMLQKVK